MIRHNKNAWRKTNFLNSKSWKTEKTIEDIYELIIDENELNQEYKLPYEQKHYSEGEEAVFKALNNSHQLNAHEYRKKWKKTEIDFIYMDNISEKIDNTVNKYQERI